MTKYPFVYFLRDEKYSEVDKILESNKSILDVP